MVQVGLTKLETRHFFSVFSPVHYVPCSLNKKSQNRDFSSNLEPGKPWTNILNFITKKEKDFYCHPSGEKDKIPDNS